MMGSDAALVFATRNPGKVEELRALFADTNIAVRSLAELLADGSAIPEVVEDGVTFTDNALKKARAIAAVTGLPALADDSGLEVDALGGAPGVHSARYAGESASDADNNEKLLRALHGLEDDRRTARFRSVLAFVACEPRGRGTESGTESTTRRGTEITTTGTCEGRILHAPRGTGGFGYDPLFFSDELRATFAEAGIEAKNQLSHRARAMAAMKPRILDYFQLANPAVSR